MQSKLVHIPDWSKSTLGTQIPLWRFRNGNTQRPILFVGGVHGDEPEGVWLAEDFLLWLKDHATVSDWKQFCNFDLITCLNIDGFSRNQRTNGNGVDLNRNFPSKDWSTESKAPRYFPGSAPNSEPETKSLVSLIQEINPIAIVHFHSWKPCVVFTGDVGEPFARILGNSSGYETHPDIGYPTPGSLGQYGWLNHNIPVICIEEAEGTSRPEIWKRFKNGLIELIKIDWQNSLKKEVESR